MYRLVNFLFFSLDGSFVNSLTVNSGPTTLQDASEQSLSNTCILFKAFYSLLALRFIRQHLSITCGGHFK